MHYIKKIMKYLVQSFFIQFTFLHHTRTDRSFWRITNVRQYRTTPLDNRRSFDKFSRRCIRWVGINYFAGKWSRGGVARPRGWRDGIRLKEIKRAERVPGIQHRLAARGRNRRSRSGRRWSVKHRPILPALPAQSTMLELSPSRSAKSCIGCLRLVLRNPFLRRANRLNCFEKCAIPIEYQRLHRRNV